MDVEVIILIGGGLIFIIFIQIMIWKQESDMKKRQAETDEREKEVSAGSPTFEGKVVNVVFSAGRFACPDLTTIYLESGRMFIIYDLLETLVVGRNYQFWVDSKNLLDYKEMDGGKDE
ncbi:MAG: hypothetical protein ACTSPB_00015 [Candidatus Thorarchaeota archaeon]